MDTASPIALQADPVRQFSIFAENRVGRLSDVASLLARHQVHIMAVTTLDTTDSTLVRLIVDDPDQARKLFRAASLFHTECDVLAAEIPTETSLRDALAALLEAEINIHYLYAFLIRPNELPAVAMSVEDRDIAAQALNKRGLRVLTQGDISR